MTVKKKSKPYKIVKSDLFKEQEKLMSAKIQKEIDEAIKEIAKNPYAVKGSMSLFGKPTAEELTQWCSGDCKIEADQIDLIFEYLGNKGCLTRKGKKLQKEFWKKYIETITEDTK